MRRTTLLVLCLAVSVLTLAACTPQEPVDMQKQIQTWFLEAQPGSVIEIPEGTFELERSLSLNVDGVTVRGAGMDKTVLSFKNQIQGAEGMLVTASDFTIEDLAIEDSKGDALKVNEGDNITIRRVRTEWTGGPSESNGAYGIYPVQTRNVLIEESVAIAASDAGIYVGQSDNVVVRNNRAEYNVAGIEIENTIGADVYDNVAKHNTGGILVFNMPNLPRPGHSTRVYNNVIESNNTDNFAPEGTAVASVLAGSGVVINSNDKVEIFENSIKNNKTANVVISSYFSTGYFGEREAAEDYDPYPEAILIADNDFEGGGEAPDMAELEQLRVAMFGEDGRLPHIIWDGFFNDEKSENGQLLPEYAICVSQGEDGVMNVDSPNGFSNPTLGLDGHSCELPRLSPISLAATSG